MPFQSFLRPVNWTVRRRACERIRGGDRKESPRHQIYRGPCPFNVTAGSVVAVDQHGETAGADDLLLTLVVAGEVCLARVTGTADEALDLGHGHRASPPTR